MQDFTTALAASLAFSVIAPVVSLLTKTLVRKISKRQGEVNLSMPDHKNISIKKDHDETYEDLSEKIIAAIKREKKQEDEKLKRI